MRGHRPLPGDDVLPTADYQTTRAVTIQASAESIWPWLVQMGQDRAGFYTHNWVERLLRSGIPDVSEIHPEWQHIEAGDLVDGGHGGAHGADLPHQLGAECTDVVVGGAVDIGGGGVDEVE